ncbi:MAG: nodulation protein NfeD, partial [candidate division KSB1 bacterium]|nr:nodulation protein NfeD [candidate division KSB1 bacterium]
LLMLGIYGLFFELSNPGAIIPGVAGGISIILAFMALQTLPVSTAGILLILFALVLFILEIKVTSYGILTIGGITAMFLGSIMLIEETPGFSLRVDWRIALTFALFTAAFFIFALGMALKTRLTQPTTGKEGMVGATGIALSDLEPGKTGQVQVWGEIWQANSGEKIAKGETIRVLAVKGLLMNVEKAAQSNEQQEA